MRNFKKNDSGFICAHCGAEVPPLGYTSRDHCNKCLHSLHVDIIPGDRENECKGTLVPVQTLPDAKKGFIIIYKCAKCGSTVRNMAARDDDTELLIKLTAVKG
ncbi:MAG: RNHCP domain-containing protein [Ruminococcaceae bacterium]|nr:RNHCP domain-containing protein [Oscillospiraceae bacterium]